MRTLAILTFVSLDGVMQGVASPDEDRSGGFDAGGWALPYWAEVMAQVSAEAIAVSYDLLLGRKTYDLFAANQPNAAAMTRATKYVVTSSPDTLSWDNSVALTGDFVGEISRLKQGDGPLLQVHGSWQLTQTLLAYKLIDEFRLWTFPVVLGSGKRLFENGSLPASLALKKPPPATMAW